MWTTLIISIVIYLCMIFSNENRTAIAALGSGILLIYGTFSNSFSAELVFQKFPTEIMILIIVLAQFAKVFEKNGVFSYIGKKFIRISKGKRILITILLPLAIYIGSLFMNNLSIILLFTFICLELATNFKLKITPLLVSAIIASNIGGAALPWADTPAVILTLYTDFTLIDFLTKLFIPSLVYIILLTGYTVVWFKYLDKKTNHSLNDESNFSQLDNNKHKPHNKPHNKPHENLINNKANTNKEIREKDHKESKMSIFIFFLLIISICIAPFLKLSIAYVAIFFGALLLIIVKDSPQNILNSLQILDSLVFISTLFLIAGALEYSGILTIFVEYILQFAGQSIFIILLSIMVAAFFIATFLSAGPAAATLLPICQQLAPLVGNNLVFAALALGILAGSSMLPWSATGGPVMLNEVNRFIKQHNLSLETKGEIKKIFILKNYMAFSIPFSFIILFLSAIFLKIYTVMF